MLIRIRERIRNIRWTKKAGLVSLSLLPVLAFLVAATVAYIVTATPPKENVFTPSQVTVDITEDFDGKTKKNVNARNIGDTDAWIRVKLISYRVNDAGDRIGGKAPIGAFTPGTGWVEHGGFYYYTTPVAPGEQPPVPLIDTLALNVYEDADGGRQVVEVMAEGIQATPDTAVHTAWGVDITEGSVTAYSGS